jgi:hypothetical protein
MASKKQIEANRRNAQKSTGPTTEEGKAMVRLNALRHGITAESAVIPYVEQAEDWEAHREGVIESLVPVGHLETVLAERVAMLLWRLGRANRYEREVVAVGQEKIEEKHFEYDKEYGSVDILCKVVKQHQRLQRLIDRLPTMKSESAVLAEDAYYLVDEVGNKAQKVNLEEFSLPGIPDDIPLEDFKCWTVGLVRGAVEAIAEAEGKPVEELLQSARFSFLVEEVKAKRLLEQAELEIGRKRRTRLLPEPQVLNNLTRYESHLERSLYKTMHEIERLQAVRAGRPMPPPMAVDVTVDAS